VREAGPSDLRRLVQIALRASVERKKVEADLERALEERDTHAVYALARKLLGLPPASVS
jgi:hypothetical protein